MAGIDTQIAQRMALGPQALQQRYAQTRELVDLLALQKLNRDKQEAARAIQASMQTNPATVKDQLEQNLMAAERDEVTNEMNRGIASMLPGVQAQGQRMAQAQARSAAGIPTQPAPNMARMAGGGIVAFQEGGDVEAVKEYIRLSERLKEPGLSPEAQRTINRLLEDLKTGAQDQSRFMLEVERARGFDPAEEYERSMQEQNGMYGGGRVKGYAGPEGSRVDGNEIVLDDQGNIVTSGPEGDTGDEPRPELRMPVPVGEAISQGLANLKRRLSDIYRVQGEAQLATALPYLDEETYVGDVARRIVAGEEVSPRQAPPAEPAPTTTPEPAKTYPEASEEDIQAFFEALKTPEEVAPEKREIDWDALREFLIGGAGATSIGTALAGGAARMGEEMRRREAIGIEERALESELQNEIDQLNLRYGYELTKQERDIAADIMSQERDFELTAVLDALKDVGADTALSMRIMELEEEYANDPEGLAAAKTSLIKQHVMGRLRGGQQALGSYSNGFSDVSVSE